MNNSCILVIKLKLNVYWNFDIKNLIKNKELDKYIMQFSIQHESYHSSRKINKISNWKIFTQNTFYDNISIYDCYVGGIIIDAHVSVHNIYINFYIPTST